MYREPIEPSEMVEMKAWFLPYRSKKQKTMCHDLGARWSQRTNVISTGIVDACQLKLKEIWTLQRAPPSIWFDMRLSWYATTMISRFICSLCSPTYLLFYKYPSLSFWLSFWLPVVLHEHSWTIILVLFYSLSRTFVTEFYFF